MTAPRAPNGPVVHHAKQLADQLEIFSTRVGQGLSLGDAVKEALQSRPRLLELFVRRNAQLPDVEQYRS